MCGFRGINAGMAADTSGPQVNGNVLPGHMPTGYLVDGYDTDMTGSSERGTGDNR